MMAESIWAMGSIWSFFFGCPKPSCSASNTAKGSCSGSIVVKIQSKFRVWPSHKNITMQPSHEQPYLFNSRFVSQSRLLDDPSYPFGQEGVKIANYVSSQMNHSIDEENKRVLEKFRIDAIKHRNQRVMKHLGRIPYITESMLPGMNVNPSMFMDRPPQPIPPPLPLRMPVPATVPVYPLLQTRKSQEVEVERILKPRTISMRRSVGVEANFQEEFPLQKKKKALKKKYYTIENYEEELAFDKIGSMLQQINKKITYNSKILSDSVVNSKTKVKQLKVQQQEKEFFPKPRIHRQKFWTEQPEQTSRPAIQYSNQLKRINTEQAKRPKNLQDHLKMLKEKRQRMDDLDEGIIRMQTYQ